MIKQMRSVALSLLCLFTAAACSDKFENEQEEVSNLQVLTEAKSTTYYESCFAQMLSAAISDRQDVREFLKAEALKQFDKKSDILYVAVKNEKVDGEAFGDILASYEADIPLSEIEANVPLLNIYLTRTALFDVYPENLDVTDAETPVAVATSDSTLLYVAGAYEGSIAASEVPSFHVFVVGENKRVIIDGTSGGNLKSASAVCYHFKAPEYDGTQEDESSSLKSVSVPASKVGNRAIQAYKYFYANDNSVNQMAFQRDYIYYGITPSSQSGSIIHSVSDYILSIKVDPKAYQLISDADLDNALRKDPYIKCTSTSIKKRQFTDSELVKQFWTEGTYDFVINMVSSNNSLSKTIRISARPEDLWNFNINCARRHKTKFRHTRYTYTIDESKFTAKEYFLDTPVELGNWNIKSESLYRHFVISEEDQQMQADFEYEVSNSFVKSNGSNVELKVGIGLSDGGKLETTITPKASDQNTTTSSKKVKVTMSLDSDVLGSVSAYYYDPIVESIASDGTPTLHQYTTGLFSMTLTAK